MSPTVNRALFLRSGFLASLFPPFQKTNPLRFEANKAERWEVNGSISLVTINALFFLQTTDKQG
jgi:hypothetical protein